MPQTRKYEYAVMDGNEAPDQRRQAVSCHHTVEAARREAHKRNRADPNYRFYVIPWNAERWAWESSAPEHPEGL